MISYRPDESGKLHPHHPDIDERSITRSDIVGLLAVGVLVLACVVGAGCL